MAHTEPVSTAHTEPVVIAIEDTESGDKTSVEDMDKAAGTQALQATSARLAAIRLRELGDDDHDDHASRTTIPSLSDQVTPKALTNNQKTTTVQAQHGRRNALAVPILTFLAGITIGGVILYFWLNSGSWLSEPPFNVADSISLPKPGIVEPSATPSTSKGLIRQESDSIAQSTTVDDPDLNLPGLSGRKTEQGTSSLNTTGNEPINPEVSVQSTASLDKNSTLAKEKYTLDEQYTDSAPITDNDSKNTMSNFSGNSEEAVFQHASIRQDQQAKSWTIPFIFNKLNIDPKILNGLLPELRQCGGVLDIVGHTCTLGDDKGNFYVGLARADYVREQLFKNGISERRLRVSSDGSDRPVATNSTKEGRILNRRVEIHCRAE
jgi:outer membrane protein OmpA-like peptidoglycan-associated protein